MFDKSKPFAQVSGDSDAKFEQGGRYFDAQGKEVTIEPEAEGAGMNYAEELTAIKAELAEIRAELAKIKSAPVVKTASVGTDVNIIDDLNSLDWREIKKMVIEAGGEWDNKADGIAFLGSK